MIFIVQAFSKLHHLIDLVIIGVHALLEFFMLLNQFLHGFYGGLWSKSKEHTFTPHFTDTSTMDSGSGAYNHEQMSWDTFAHLALLDTRQTNSRA